MRAFETTHTVDPQTLEENWRAYSIEDVQAYVHGDPVIKPNARFGVGRSENEAIVALLMQEEAVNGVFLYAGHMPKYSFGQRVFVQTHKRNYYGTISQVLGCRFSSLIDKGNGLELIRPYKYQYTIEEFDGKEHQEVLEDAITLMEDDGA